MQGVPRCKAASVAPTSGDSPVHALHRSTAIPAQTRCRKTATSMIFRQRRPVENPVEKPGKRGDMPTHALQKAVFLLPFAPARTVDDLKPCELPVDPLCLVLTLHLNTRYSRFDSTKRIPGPTRQPRRASAGARARARDGHVPEHRDGRGIAGMSPMSAERVSHPEQRQAFPGEASMPTAAQAPAPAASHSEPSA